MGIVCTKGGDTLVSVFIPGWLKSYSIQAHDLQKHAQVRKTSLVVIPYAGVGTLFHTERSLFGLHLNKSCIYIQSEAVAVHHMSLPGEGLGMHGKYQSWFTMD